MGIENEPIPSDGEAKAAQWLSGQNFNFETPIFWSVVGILKLYEEFLNGSD